MKPRYTRLRGMPDLLPEETGAWHTLEAAVRDTMHAYGYREIRTPLVERRALFERSIGEATDIVEKEMYVFEDRRGERIALRPENTAGCVRAAIENGLLDSGGAHRIWYQGPMFRYERPQLGRQRQFMQTGAEVYGVAGPEIEAELILLACRLWRALGIEDALRLEINTLGSATDREAYRSTLVAFFDAHRDQLDEDSLRRLERNPMRILDSKNPEMQAMLSTAPTFESSLGDASREHFETVRSLLSATGVDAVVNPRIVRGLDYYSHTVFEFVTDRLGAQSAVCAGGRYDGLLEQLGAPGTPGVGWAFGMERVLALLGVLERRAPDPVPDAYVMRSDRVPAAAALALAERVRTAVPAASVVLHPGGGSLKSQFKRADRLGARVALLLGEDEHAAGKVTVKPLRGGDQRTLDARALPAALAALLEPVDTAGSST